MKCRNSTAQLISIKDIGDIEQVTFRYNNTLFKNENVITVGLFFHSHQPTNEERLRKLIKLYLEDKGIKRYIVVVEPNRKSPNTQRKYKYITPIEIHYNSADHTDADEAIKIITDIRDLGNDKSVYSNNSITD